MVLGSWALGLGPTDSKVGFLLRQTLLSLLRFCCARNLSCFGIVLSGETLGEGAFELDGI